MSARKCQAKDPAKCAFHGKRQLGVKAEEHIRAMLTTPGKRYYLSAAERATRPLKEMNATGLALTISEFAHSTEGISGERIDEAILFAAAVHRKHFRTNRGRYPYTPYIEHPLRNTLRLIRYGCKDEAALIAALLHDTVEDGPFEIARDFYGEATKDEALARERAYAYIERRFGKNACKAVHGMSNPLGMEAQSVEEKNAAYAKHVREAIEDPRTAVGKISDLVDNAVGLYHNLPGMKPEAIRRRAIKYRNVWPDVEARIQREIIERRFPITDEGLEEMRRNLAAGWKRLTFLATLPDSAE